MRKHFHLVLFAVLSLTAFCGALAVAIAFLAADPVFVDRAFNTFLGLFTLGVGTVIGLLGGAK
jgi:hypothetical protein